MGIFFAGRCAGDGGLNAPSNDRSVIGVDENNKRRQRGQPLSAALHLSRGDSLERPKK
jgi:hypothetical protein